MIRFLSLVMAVLAVASVGCSRKTQPVAQYRNVEFHLKNDDPSGFYVLEFTNEQAAAIEDDLQIDVIGHVCQIDKAFLKQSIQSFHHNGRLIGQSGDPTRIARDSGLRVWNLKRTDREAWYYVGTLEQYRALDLTRPLQVGDRVLTL
jgi:hypothetical protein